MKCCALTQGMNEKSSHVPSLLMLAAALLPALVFPLQSQAEDAGPPGATVQGLLEWADAHNPELAAMQYEVDAATARGESAGALDDPMLRMELQDIDNSNPNLLPSKAGAAKYTVLQSFPLWGKRELRRALARTGTEEARGRKLAAVAELHAQIKAAYARRFFTLHAYRLTAQVLELMRDLENIAQTRYANGLAPQQDVIRAQTEQTAMRIELVALEAEQVQTQARLNALLSRPALAPLADPQALRPLPPPAKLGADDLAQRARNANPQLLTQMAQIQAASNNERLIVKNRYPDLTVGVSPVQRGERLDSWELMLEINLPLQRAARRNQEQEAGAMLAAAQQREQAVANQVLSELQEAAAGFESVRRQEQLLKSTLVPQAGATLDSALASYQTGKVDFATLLDAQRGIRKARLDQLKAHAELEIRRSEIERLLGEDL